MDRRTDDMRSQDRTLHYSASRSKNSITYILRKVESNFCHFGVRPLLMFTPWGGQTPLWPMRVMALEVLRKMVFSWGYWLPFGEIWGFENCIFGHIWSPISQNPFVQIPPFSALWKTLWTSRDFQNLKKFWPGELEKNMIKFGKKITMDLEIFTFWQPFTMA